MKHTKLLLALILLLVFSLVGCQKEPTAAFTSSKTSTLINDTVSFTNFSKDADYYEWDFGDNTKSKEKNPIHIYTKQSDYKVTLTAFNKSGKKSSSVSQKIIIGAIPYCGFTFSPKFPKPGETVHFIDNSINNTTTWLWNFGDGTTSTEKSPNHIYSAENKYKVTLNITNNFGSYEQSDSVIVLNNTPVMPTADFSYVLAPVLTAKFEDKSTGIPTIWQWEFGDGTFSSLQNPTHIYSRGGNYEVIFRAFNLAGSHKKIQTINMPSSVPVSKFIYSEGTDYTIIFKDISTGNPSIWKWTFGDGANDTIKNPIHQYSSAGDYTVTFKTTNIAGPHQMSQHIHVSNYIYTFIAGNYNIVDDGGGNNFNYADQITPAAENNKFYTTSFANIANATVFFLLSGTTVNVPLQTINCGSPPNITDHIFYGSGYFVENGQNVSIVINYTDSTSTITRKRTGTYTKIITK